MAKVQSPQVYHIVDAASIYILKEEVQNHLNEGWLVTGGVTVDRAGERTIYYQTLVYGGK